MTILGLQEEGRRPGFRLKEGQRHTELLYGAEVAALDGVRLAEVAVPNFGIQVEITYALLRIAPPRELPATD